MPSFSPTSGRDGCRIRIPLWAKAADIQTPHVMHSGSEQKELQVFFYITIIKLKYIIEHVLYVQYVKIYAYLGVFVKICENLYFCHNF